MRSGRAVSGPWAKRGPGADSDRDRCRLGPLARILAAGADVVAGRRLPRPVP